MKGTFQIALATLFCSCSSYEPSFDYAQIYPDSVEKKYQFPDYQRHSDLTNEDLEKAEELLLSALEEYKAGQETILTKEALQSYKRQYVSYINNEGQRIIWINGFCRILEVPTEVRLGEYEALPWDWKNEIIEVDDGGPCYWRATINMDNKKGDLMINGI